MSYEEDYREPYSSPCACRKGVLRYYRIVKSNDWGQQQESSTSVEILCDFCKAHYHFEYTHFGDGLLVPNGVSIPPEIPCLDYKQQYSSDEEFIGEHDKEVIEAMIADMTAPKHRFKEAHKFDPFNARVTYHDSCRVDSTGRNWDSLHILECVHWKDENL